jgi:hypothetical protein
LYFVVSPWILKDYSPLNLFYVPTKSVAKLKRTCTMQVSLKVETMNAGNPTVKAPLVAVRTWLSPNIGFTGIHSVIPTGIAQYTLNLHESLTIPPGSTGYIIITYGYEKQFWQVASSTKWECNGGEPVWGNDDDVAFWPPNIIWQAARDGRVGGAPIDGCGNESHRHQVMMCTCAPLWSAPLCTRASTGRAATAIMIIRPPIDANL